MALNLQAIGKKFGPYKAEYNFKDVILYALGVGAGFDELDYVYENRLKVVPSFAVTTIYGVFSEAAVATNANLAGILHGEQDTIFYNPIPTEGTISTSLTITNMYDKGQGKGALVVAEADSYHSNGQKLYKNFIKLFCRLDGGFGGDPGPAEAVEFPERAPDFEEKAGPTLGQPLLYRLSGDYFALHVDPDFAKASGFQMPIMHGLCTHGFACRAVIKHLFPGEPERMTRFRVRFSKPLYPGQPIVTQIWKVEDGRALFRVINAETKDLILDRGIVEWLSKAELERRARLGAINFDGRVAIVTGAGAGLGRTYALELGKRGAKIVVNDLGGARDGTGASTSAADKVVEEIKALGGEAVANYDSVATAAGGQAIVDTAVKAFGRVDVLINNAGILRDKTMVKMEPENWDAIMDVHLKGAYNVTRPAFIKMREAGYGRIVMTTSAAGLYGNFGQTNYSAAKMGLIGFMNTLKLEGDKFNIKVNTIAPVAATRLTEDVLPPEMFAKLKPEFVAPLALYLSSEQCPVSGAVYNAGLGYFNRAAILTGPGVVVGDGTTPPSVEEVAAAMDKIKSLQGAAEFPNATAAFTPMIEAFSPKKQAETPAAGAAPTAKAIMEGLPGAFQADKAGGVEVVFGFNLTGAGGGEWTLAIKDGKCDLKAGAPAGPNCTLAVGADDFVKMMTGQVKAMSLFTSGKLKIGGDVMKSQLLEKLFKR
ncbi:MAG: SDR family NAD(P)-dependent oxidoreductase [Thermodesulfobacteriota bacterium]